MYRPRIYSLIILLVTTILCANAVAQDLSRRGGFWVHQSEREFPAAAINKIHLSGFHGSLSVSVWTRDIVGLDMTLKMDVFTEKEARELARASEAAPQNQEGTLYLGGKTFNRNYLDCRLELHVPARLSGHFQLATGDIEINGLDGSVLAATGVGELTIINIGGAVKASTGAGEVEISEVDGDLIAESGAGEIEIRSITGDADIRTGAGEITVNDVAGMLMLSTGGGEIDVQNACMGLELTSGGGEITLTDMGGEITVDSGGGSIELADCKGNIRISTGGGSLEGRRVYGNLAMSTGGGDVDLSQISASLDISTGGGDITVDMGFEETDTEFQMMLSTGGGGIDLGLPRLLPARIEALVRYRQRAWEDYEIDSDFPLAIEEREEGRYQIIEARGQINNGKNLIQLKATSGDIRIRRH